MELRHVQEEDRNQECEDDRWYEVPVETMIHDRQTASPECEEIEPLPANHLRQLNRCLIVGLRINLHDNKVDKVNRARGIENIRLLGLR